MNILHKVVLILAAASTGAALTPMEPSIKSFERPTWNQQARVTADDTMEVTFVVKTCPMKKAKLEEKFWAVSDPRGPDYKKYLKLNEIADMLHPVKEGELSRAEQIVQFLNTQEGLVADKDIKVTKTRDLVTATLNAKAAEEFFGTELYHYTPKLVRNGVDLIRAAAPYSLPDELAEKVSIVDKLVRLPQVVEAKRDTSGPRLRKGNSDDDPFNSCDATACTGATTPQVLQERYQFPSLNQTSGSTMACTEFQLQGIDDDDLNNFKTACGVDHVAVDDVEGAGGSAIAGVEALLDVEYIEAVAAPIPLTVINSIQYSLFDWSQELNNDENPAWVQSVSYGNDEVQQTSVEYMEECNQQFQLNGARGLSVLFASGDQGVWGRTGHDTTGEFHPDFPASSPYVTAVGGTQFSTVSTIGDETTWADGGGGFSNTFSIPDYQSDAVAAYLSSGVELPDSNQYNATGRAYPDVAALAGVANGYCVAAKGRFEKVGGTSAACPVFAGQIAILNDMLLASGQQPMGFLNPWIYYQAGPGGAFNDVTTGTNNANFGNGFTATTGWDPATGFGTPNFPAMQKILGL